MRRKTSLASSKRFTYVLRTSDDSAAEMTADSSDEESIRAPPRKKVRQEFSVRNLKKSSECFKMDEDHIYSKSSEERERTLEERLDVRSHSSQRVVEDLQKYHCEALENYGRTSEHEDRISSVNNKREKCNSKNAQLARLNREKKKKYIAALEASNTQLQTKNDEILVRVRKQSRIIATLQHEIVYLKSLLANSKEISQILKSLKESTGLPVTTSLQSLSHDGFGNLQPCESYAHDAHVKRVTSGSNFPILQKDVNLGACIDFDDNDYDTNYESTEFDVPTFMENDHGLNSSFLNEMEYELRSSLFDISLDSVLDTEYEVNKNDDSLKTYAESNELESNVGVCLHINKQRISVEVCSICNKRAQVL